MFETLIPDARQFIAGLAANNTRDWFQENKARYETTMKAPALALLEAVAPELEKICGYPVGQKLFRIHRDVRFSKDKRPYKEHLHVMWPIEAGARQNPVMFFGIGPDYVTAGTGMMGFDKGVLADWRTMADMDGDHLAKPINAALAKGFTAREPELKRIPPAYDKDHAHGDLLRRKGLVVTGELGADVALPDGLIAAFKDLWPVADMLIGVAEAPAL